MYRERYRHERDDGLLSGIEWLVWLPLEFAYYFVEAVFTLVATVIRAVVAAIP